MVPIFESYCALSALATAAFLGWGWAKGPRDEA